MEFATTYFQPQADLTELPEEPVMGSFASVKLKLKEGYEERMAAELELLRRHLRHRHRHCPGLAGVGRQVS